MSSQEAQYDIVLYGATGYTGRLCAEHIVSHLPINLKWAIAGRNWMKLAEIVERLKAINPDRAPPAIEIAGLQKEEMEALARKTRLIITTVGPYCNYGEPIIAACAETGTHYLDCTGEIPWLYDMVEQYHEKAKSTGAILIPQCGVDSVPADITAYVLAEHLRSKHSAPTANVLNCLYRLDSMASGGTLGTIVALFEKYSASQLQDRLKPHALSPLKLSPDASPLRKSPLTKILGITHHPSFGTLTSWFQSAPDTSIVYRSWGLLQQSKSPLAYGPHFTFSEWKRARNPLTGILLHYALVFASVSLFIPPLRWLFKKVIYAPGTGPNMTTATHDLIDYRAIADADSPGKQRAESKFEYHGSMYMLTGLTLAEAAAVILGEGEGRRHLQSLGGGLLTPACLGMEYVERLRKVGVQIEVGDSRA